MVVVVVPPGGSESVFEGNGYASRASGFNQSWHPPGTDAVVSKKMVLSAQFPGDTIDHDKLMGLVGVGLPGAGGILEEFDLVII